MAGARHPTRALGHQQPVQQGARGWPRVEAAGCVGKRLHGTPGQGQPVQQGARGCTGALDAQRAYGYACQSG